jgi:GT2 family glycosyltransferase
LSQIPHGTSGPSGPVVPLTNESSLASSDDVVIPYISVVIPTLHREEPLCNTLRYFIEVETYPHFELIVVDQSDQHNQATADFLSDNSTKLRHIRVDYKSLPKARNHGVRLAHGEIIVFVDDDVQPAKNFLWEHARCYMDPLVIGVAGPGPFPGEPLKSRDMVGEDVYKSLITQQSMRFDVSFSFSAQWAQGCNMSFRRELILRLGGFDEGFRHAAIGEDAEFCHRARKRGLILYSPDAFLVHVHEARGGCRDSASRRAQVRNIAFCINYFWFRIDAPIGQRARAIWRLFRAEVVSAEGFRLHSGIGFLDGIVRSTVYIFRMRKRVS